MIISLWVVMELGFHGISHKRHFICVECRDINYNTWIKTHNAREKKLFTSIIVTRFSSRLCYSQSKLFFIACNRHELCARPPCCIITTCQIQIMSTFFIFRGQNDGFLATGNRIRIQSTGDFLRYKFIPITLSEKPKKMYHFVKYYQVCYCSTL